MIVEPCSSTTSSGISSTFAKDPCGPAVIPVSKVRYLCITLPFATKRILLHVPCDLHVLATPPAFVLSQDQTLRLIISDNQSEGLLPDFKSSNTHVCMRECLIDSPDRRAEARQPAEPHFCDPAGRSKCRGSPGRHTLAAFSRPLFTCQRPAARPRSSGPCIVTRRGSFASPRAPFR